MALLLVQRCFDEVPSHLAWWSRLVHSLWCWVLVIAGLGTRVGKVWPYLSASEKRLGGISDRADAALSVPSRLCPCVNLLALCLLRHCAVRFAGKVPTWRLPASGHAAGLVTAKSSAADVVEVGFGGEEVSWLSGSGQGQEENPTEQKKNPAYLAGISGVQSRTRVWKI